MRFIVGLMLVVLASAGCSSADSSSSTVPSSTTTTVVATTAAPPKTTTTVATTTSSEATTTTVATTTTNAPVGTVVDATPVVAALQPYNEQGAGLFPTGSVQAHWYQWDGLYVVVYRGFDAEAMPICAGNSIQESTGFTHISNSPSGAAADEICDGVPKIADAPSGAYTCGPLLYYLTEIPTETVGNLFGTLEIVQDGGGVVYGQTSAVGAALDQTPEFEPGLASYELPASSVDDLTSVVCG